MIQFCFVIKLTFFANHVYIYQMNNQITKLLLNSYNSTINELNSALIEHFQLENNFIAPGRAHKEGLIPQKGKIDHNNNIIEFRFHGTGCEFKSNGLVADFDYTFDSNDSKISFGPYEFKKFVQSFIESSDFLTKDEKTVAESLSIVTNTEDMPFKL
jgi:hypothetical protein